MTRTSLLTRIPALLGTVLVWFPLVFTIVISAISFISERVFLLDYLMPAELFPVAFIGGALLMWAALRARSRRTLIVCGFVGAIALLVGSQALAVATGMASGETEPVGWPWLLVNASLAGYVLALFVLGIAGLLLLRDLFRHDKTANAPVALAV